MKNKKLRLLVTAECNRSCKGCCNKQWDLNSIPVCEDFTGYEEILLTGGEPMLFTTRVNTICHIIRKENPKAKIYIYTAKPMKILLHWIYVDKLIDGITLTLHTIRDIAPFVLFEDTKRRLYRNRWMDDQPSFRLNVFKQVRFKAHGLEAPEWKVKDNMEWIKDCPLPVDEDFMRF